MSTDISVDINAVTQRLVGRIADLELQAALNAALIEKLQADNAELRGGGKPAKRTAAKTTKKDDPA